MTTDSIDTTRDDQVAWGCTAAEADRITRHVAVEVGLADPAATALRARLVSTAPPSVVRELAAARRERGPGPSFTAVETARADTATTVTMLAGFDLLEPRYWSRELDRLLAGAHAREGGPGVGPDLVTLAAVLSGAGAGVDGPRAVWRWRSRRWGGGVAHDRSTAESVDFARTHLDVVLGDRPAPGDWELDDAVVFTVLALFDELPTVAVDWLWDTAVGGRKLDRRRAQDLLETLPHWSDRAGRLTDRLAAGQADIRRHTAAWLARRPDPDLLVPLERAVAKEKQEAAKGAMLDALEALGRPVAHYLDPAGLLAEAERAQAKGWPQEIGWLALDRMPGVRWATGDLVPPLVVLHLVAKAVRAKTPEPHAVLRKTAALLDAADRERLARWLLDAWLEEDQRRVDGLVGGYRGFGYLVSAADSKGLLAVVGACAGPDVVGIVERFVHTHYGYRAAQCKALLPMLAWVDQPGAVQAVLSIATRFRTKGIKDLAHTLVLDLAERRGWTLDELADRTVPTAGFEDGALLLSYGPRTFTGVLLPDLTVRVTDADGKVLKALPAPRQTDDAELASTAKKTLASARKEVKAIATSQARRLRDAWCVERVWDAPSWHEHVLTHPLVGRLARRLVWLAGPPQDPSAVSFRPLDDGTLADAHDATVVLDPGWTVRLAHDTLLPQVEVARWLEHLADYEVEPPFVQLGRGVFELPDELVTATRLSEVEGHVVGHFRLRSTAARLGWHRGEIGDGPTFTSWDQTYPTLGLVAHVHFSGAFMPEGDEPRALLGLSFARLLPEGRGEVTIPLGEVPRVLLTETRHDLLALAGAGSGFDPDWKTLEI